MADVKELKLTDFLKINDPQVEKSEREALKSQLGDTVKKVQQDKRNKSGVARILYDLIQNRGHSDILGGKYDFKDITSEQVRPYVPDLVRIIIKEEVEPRTPISTLVFDNIQVDVETNQIELGVQSNAFVIDQIAEGSSFPTVEFSIGGGEKISTHLRKYGAKIGITEEAEAYDKRGWNFMGLFTRGIANAIARKKENIAVMLMRHQGFVAYDNDTPVGTIYGQTTGRDISGTPNGTLSVRDINYQIAWMQNRGYNPDTLIMNPLAWIIFSSVPEIRESMIVNGGLTNLTIPRGTYSPDLGTRLGKFGTNYVAKGESDPSQLTAPWYKLGNNPYVQSINLFGSVFEFRGPMFPSIQRLILTPFVPIRTFTNAGTDTIKASDVMLVDSANVGAFFNQTALADINWFDPEHQMRWVAMYTRFGVAPYAHGEGICIAKNVVLDEQFVFQNVNQVTLTPIPRFPAAANSIINP